ncbi:ATP-binding cassette domain-containing protein [Virgibacillus dakarensis]|uniref:Bacitracin ABC transporter ATP-binding protein n=1 Tax=Lentibacillus populi TaxID=1827502 RepID=A0A9W5TYQ5_9BACI|nr:ABC transporter ATP-binding protein [Lentibacillus populi]MBT2215672.1 ABC transporter ATP-binding protein [Virgibacillus dakarensis]MTW85713.1 ATP-binding cassette domain-containing protein [Virgibacillus dakarensis]GGB46121.1 bacitracin ABC transporter ATP-binding protein [Lentibacillus populi]
MQNHVLRTFDLTKKYREQVALNHVNMTIEKGDIYGLIGRNGAGKTTLIRMITGLVAPSEGSMELFTQTVESAIRHHRRRIGSIIESPSLYPSYTAYQNMKVRQLTLGIPDEKRITEVLNTIGLADTGNKKVKNFSLGMKQRLGLGLALLSNPDFLILDEPTNGLDPEGIREMRHLLKELNESYNITILISSHILGELSKIATRYGVIHNGDLVDEFTKRELETRCRQYLRVQVDHIEKATFVLENKLQITDYEVMDEETLHIYELLDRSGDICLAFAQDGVKVTTIESKGDDLESYFLNLMGGLQHA